MRESHTAFRSDCADLRSELDLGPTLLAALAAAHAEEKQKLTTLTTRSKRQSYVNGIISLYGLIEEAVGKVVMEVADAYCGIYTSYSDLPERTRTSYREFTLKALLEKDRVRLRQPFDEKAVFHTLVSNMSDLQPQMLSSVFTYATANYRFGYIAELMQRVDIDINAILNSGEVNRKLVDTGLDFLSIDSLLGDLVARRNEVAHSYRATDLLDVGTLRAYLDVVEVFIDELQRIASERVLRCLINQRLESIGKVAHVWKNAIGVVMATGSIEAPCKVILVRDSSLLVFETQSLQSDGKPLTGRVVASAEPLNLGISSPEQLPRGYVGSDVFVLPDRWSYLSIF